MGHTMGQASWARVVARCEDVFAGLLATVRAGLVFLNRQHSHLRSAQFIRAVLDRISNVPAAAAASTGTSVVAPSAAATAHLTHLLSRLDYNGYYSRNLDAMLARGSRAANTTTANTTTATDPPPSASAAAAHDVQ